MKQRLVVLTIDTITAILRDYAGKVGFPRDAKPHALRLSRKMGGKLMLVVETSELVDSPVQEIKFDLKPTHLVGGGA